MWSLGAALEVTGSGGRLPKPLESADTVAVAFGAKHVGFVGSPSALALAAVRAIDGALGVFAHSVFVFGVEERRGGGRGVHGVNSFVAFRCCDDDLARRGAGRKKKGRKNPPIRGHG